ncbi:MAG TPA: HAMP domain-containing sensor histidine kinase [Solirubrobacteraceae bacterium]|nr:HAMP domain-containing sensor histidine kinase [Solirubrobacteraceae bacterium]
MRRRLPAGLRWRLLLALVATSAVTLAATALVVLPPMQDRLRGQSADSLETAVANNMAAVEAELTRLEREKVPYDQYRFELFNVANELNEQTNARVLILDETLVPSDPSETPPGFAYDSEPLGPVPRLTQRAAIAALFEPITEIDGDTVRVAVPLSVTGKLAGSLVAERELTEAAQLVDQVRTRFLIAAAVGLSIAALLAIALSSTLLRRLARLRSAALRISDEGPESAMPRDERRDEVGDLARALARMQEELRRQEAARRAFVSTASHELRTPLTMLQGTMELLEEEIRSGRIDELDALRQVTDARTQLDRLSALSGELLDLSRLDAAVQLRSEPVELGEIVRAVAAEFELRASERSTPLATKLPDGPCWGRGDPDAVARVVRILIDNALRYGPRGEPVRIEAHTRGEHAVITVADQGEGIPPEERGRIFERFHRGSAAGSVGGFGLGLAIGRELAQRMGGLLDVDVDDPRGTRFALALQSAHAPADPVRGSRDRVSA